MALDANALEPTGTDRDALTERLRGLIACGSVPVHVVEGVGRELLHPNTPPAVRSGLPSGSGLTRKAPTAAQQIARIRVRAIMRGDALSDKHDADALHLCQAAEAGCSVFLTHDRRFVRKRQDLEAALPGLRIVGAREFLELYDAADDQAE